MSNVRKKSFRIEGIVNSIHSILARLFTNDEPRSLMTILQIDSYSVNKGIDDGGGLWIVYYPVSPVGVHLSMEMKDLWLLSISRGIIKYPAFNYRSSYYANVAPCCMHNRNLIWLAALSWRPNIFFILSVAGLELFNSFKSLKYFHIKAWIWSFVTINYNW